MSPPPCLCKVDCGAQQGPSPFFLLAAAATLIAFLIAIATSKQSSVLQSTQRRRREATSFDHHHPNGSGTDSDSDSDSDSGSGTDSDNDSDGDSSVDSQPYVSLVTIREEVETRLAAFQREQEASLQEFRASTTADTNRQRRILSDRTAAESGRLTAAIDNLRRRFAEHQANLRETNRAIQELRSRGPHTPQGSPARRPTRTPSPPGTRERSVGLVRVQETPQRVVWRATRDNQAYVAPIYPHTREVRQRRSP